jgi:hypothetical protein
MQFFTSPKDLKNWVKAQKTPDQAAINLISIIGKNEEQDIVDTCRTIFREENDIAANVLFGILAKHNITQTREGNMKDKIIKEAQMMRQDSVYGNMDMRICPKLPFSQGKRLISTYNCRHYCLDSLVFDDDPNKVYCAETLWRRHVMDKFAREFKDKDGNWVGGYINERFQVCRDDGGNNMQLAHGERTRMPRPHQYSTERRLEEGRGEKTVDLTAFNNTKMVKLASVDQERDETYQIFDDMIEMKEAGLSDEDILYKTAEHYNRSILSIASIYQKASQMLSRNNGVVYSCSKNIVKTANVGDKVGIAQLLGTRNVPAPLQARIENMLNSGELTVQQLEQMLNEHPEGDEIGLTHALSLYAKNNQTLKVANTMYPKGTTLVSNNAVTTNDGSSVESGTTVVISDYQGGIPVLQIVDGSNVTGKNLTLQNAADLSTSFTPVEDLQQGTIQEAASEVGLNDNNDVSAQDSDFPVEEK